MGLFDSDKNKDQQKYGLFNFMTENSDNQNNSEYTEQDLDNLDLEEWQKDLVRSGEYDPYDFEEESLDDDSYYNEDD